MVTQRAIADILGAAFGAMQDIAASHLTPNRTNRVAKALAPPVEAKGEATIMRTEDSGQVV